MKTPKFVMPIRKSFKLWSVRLNIVASLIVTYAMASPETILTVIGQLPAEIRVPVAIITGIVMFVLVLITRITKQSKLSTDE